MSDYDLVVIGAGSAGVWAAPFAARLGARVALVEKERIGGDWTHYGCVPSKALLKAAGVAWHLRTADRFGFDAVQPAVDLGRVMAGVRQAIGRVYAFETPEALSQVGVKTFMGAARFEDAHTLSIGTDTGVRARHFLVCTGAHPAVPPIPGLQGVPYWTYRTIWQQDRLPRRLLVIGSGAVGVELAQAFGRLGSQVTVFEAMDRVLPPADPEASAVLHHVLEGEGIQFRLGVRIERVREENSRLIVTDQGEDIQGDALLVAVGRHPNVNGLGLERARRHIFRARHRSRQPPANQSEAHICLWRRHRRSSVHALRRVAGLDSRAHDTVSRLESGNPLARSMGRLYRPGGGAMRPFGN